MTLKKKEKKRKNGRLSEGKKSHLLSECILSTGGETSY